MVNSYFEKLFGYRREELARPAGGDAGTAAVFATTIPAIARASSPIRGRGRWAPAAIWPACARTAPSSPSRSASTPLSPMARRVALAAVTDITDSQAESMRSMSGRIAAVNKSMAVIEFEMDGTIVTANDNFLKADGLLAGRDQGHGITACSSMRPTVKVSSTRSSGPSCGSGEYHIGEYRRLGKGGREVWIQGSYNPILDARTAARSRSSSTPPR